jgi:hypothetical protein
MLSPGHVDSQNTLASTSSSSTDSDIENPPPPIRYNPRLGSPLLPKATLGPVRGRTTQVTFDVSQVAQTPPHRLVRRGDAECPLEPPVHNNSHRSYSDSEDTADRLVSEQKTAEAIKVYMKRCRSRSVFHSIMSTRANTTNNWLQMIMVGLTAGQAFAMTTEAIRSVSSQDIALTGAGFAFFIAVANRAREALSLDVLSFHHMSVSTDFMEIAEALQRMLIDIDTGEGYDTTALLNLQNQIVATTARAPVQNVRYSYILRCCRKESKGSLNDEEEV